MLNLARPAVVLIALIVLCPSLASAQAAKAGVVTTLEGNVTVTRVTLAPQPLKFKDDVFVNDKVTTGDQSIARMLLGGKAVVTVRERSTLTITEVPGKATIELETGKIALAVAKDKMRPGESIEIRAANVVAGIRGTVVVAEVSSASAQVGGLVAPRGRFGSCRDRSRPSWPTSRVTPSSSARCSSSEAATSRTFCPGRWCRFSRASRPARCPSRRAETIRRKRPASPPGSRSRTRSPASAQAAATSCRRSCSRMDRRRSCRAAPLTSIRRRSRLRTSSSAPERRRIPPVFLVFHAPADRPVRLVGKRTGLEKRAIEERHGFAGVLRTSGGMGDHLGAPVNFAGYRGAPRLCRALRKVGGMGGHVGPPISINRTRSA